MEKNNNIDYSKCNFESEQFENIVVLYLFNEKNELLKEVRKSFTDEEAAEEYVDNLRENNISIKDIFERKPISILTKLEKETDGLFYKHFECVNNAHYLKGTNLHVGDLFINRFKEGTINKNNLINYVNFFKLCQKNPLAVAISELFEFTDKYNLSIGVDGRVYGFKRFNLVNTNDYNIPEKFKKLVIKFKDDDTLVFKVDGDRIEDKELIQSYLDFLSDRNNIVFRNVHNGTNTINQRIGDVVSWKGERPSIEELEVDTKRACSNIGFHVGSECYSFSGNIRVLVSFSPTDVIACNLNEGKLRTWEYKNESIISNGKEEEMNRTQNF